MRIIGALIGRNLKLYFRDRALVLYSLMSVFIIIALYALFLGNTMVESIQQHAAAKAGVRFLTDSWLMSGLILVNAVNVPLIMLNTMVVDRWSGRLRDFTTSPIRRGCLGAGYLISSWVTGILMELLTIALAEVYIVARGGEWLSPPRLIGAVLAASLCVAAYSCVFFFITLFFESPGAFSALCTVVGTLIGFLGGIYIPIGSLPDYVQRVMQWIPVTHSAALLRDIFVAAPMDALFHGAPQAIRDSTAREFGIQVSFQGHVLSDGWLVAITLLTGAVFLALSLLKTAHMHKKEL